MKTYDTTKKSLNKMAFPVAMDDPEAPMIAMGLSKREYYAAMALQGIIVSREELSQSEAAQMAVKYAEALCKELEEG